MPDGDVNGATIREAAAGALAYLTEMSPDLRGGAILDGEGAVLAASGHLERWGAGAGALLDAADRAEAEPIEQLHIATEQGEVFALRHAGLTAVAVAERLALASLLFFDMRSVLRDLAAGGDGRPGG